MLDPENGKLKPCQRYFGNGVGPTNRTHDVVDFVVAQLGKGILVAQELFVIKGCGHRLSEAEDILILFNDNVLAGVKVWRRSVRSSHVGQCWH